MGCNGAISSFLSLFPGLSPLPRTLPLPRPLPRPRSRSNTRGISASSSLTSLPHSSARLAGSLRLPLPFLCFVGTSPRAIASWRSCSCDRASTYYTRRLKMNRKVPSLAHAWQSANGIYVQLSIFLYLPVY